MEPFASGSIFTPGWKTCHSRGIRVWRNNFLQDKNRKACCQITMIFFCLSSFNSTSLLTSFLYLSIFSFRFFSSCFGYFVNFHSAMIWYMKVKKKTVKLINVSGKVDAAVMLKSESNCKALIRSFYVHVNAQYTEPKNFV